MLDIANGALQRLARLAPLSADRKVYVWQSGTGKRVLLNSLPSRALLHDDGVGFFTRGGTLSQTLYRIQLP